LVLLELFSQELPEFVAALVPPPHPPAPMTTLIVPPMLPRRSGATRSSSLSSDGLNAFTRFPFVLEFGCWLFGYSRHTLARREIGKNGYRRRGRLPAGRSTGEQFVSSISQAAAICGLVVLSKNTRGFTGNLPLRQDVNTRVTT
jgi:hypothetical protein